MVLSLIQTNGLLCFKEPGAAGNPDSFERGTDGQADRLVRAAFVSNQQIEGQGILVKLNTFHACIVRLQVDGNVDRLSLNSVRHIVPPLFVE